MGLPAGGLGVFTGSRQIISPTSRALTRASAASMRHPSELYGSGDEDGSGDLTYDFHCDAPTSSPRSSRHTASTSLPRSSTGGASSAVCRPAGGYPDVPDHELSRRRPVEARGSRAGAVCPPQRHLCPARRAGRRETRPQCRRPQRGLPRPLPASGRITPAPLSAAPCAAIRWPSGPRPRPTPGGCGSNARTPPVSGR